MIVFSSSLSSKLKANLLELMQALDMSLNGAQNNPECVSLIQAQLNGHPQLKDDPKFTGLYGRLPCGQKCTHASMVDKNAALGPAELLLSIAQSVVDSMTCNI
ncbi:hypothetical protein BDR04DRAFT_1111987 [Suillus decipiens]|nr:hypothetical protein BDR04DRAFT_1111987 [Suillus decipiens]